MIRIHNTNYATMSFDVELVPDGILTNPRSTHHYNQVMEALGTKSNPYRDQRVGCAMHIDGISAEFAPFAPVTTPSQLMDYYNNGKAALESRIRMPLNGMDYIDLDEVQGFSEEDTPFLVRETQTFGCSPDYLNGRRRIVPLSVKKRSLRELGLHWHLDLRPEYCDQRDERAKAMGKVPTNAVALAQIADQIRRKTAFLFDTRHPRLNLWYRQPGLYRPTPYGIEYRAFGSEICNDQDKLYTLANVMHTFMKDHFKGTDVRITEGEAG